MDALAAVYGSAVVPAKNFDAHIATIDRLASCAVRQKKVQIRYHSLNQNRLTVREIDPYAVYFDPDGATLKLTAFDPVHGEIRVFSVERIVSVEEGTEKFTRPADFNLHEYLNENCFNGIHGQPVKVVLKTSGITARIFAERQFHPSQKIIGRKQRRGESPEIVTIEMRVANGRGLIRFILSHLPNIEVVSPPELKAEVRRVLEEGLKKF